MRREQIHKQPRRSMERRYEDEVQAGNYAGPVVVQSEVDLQDTNTLIETIDVLLDEDAAEPGDEPVDPDA